VINWIQTGGWRDDPECVHPLLQGIAYTLNDTLGNSDRQKLLAFTTRLVGTNDRSHDEALFAFLLEHMQQINPEGASMSYWRTSAKTFAKRLRNRQRLAVYDVGFRVVGGRATTEAYHAHLTTDQLLGILTAMLDEYDRLTGRTTDATEPDYSGVCAVMSGAPA